MRLVPEPAGGPPASGPLPDLGVGVSEPALGGVPGGYLASLGPLIGEIAGVSPAAITFTRPPPRHRNGRLAAGPVARPQTGEHDPPFRGQCRSVTRALPHATAMAQPADAL